ncbi:MAG TPA: hypothetical protein VKW08_10950 [Xanthobacteraceae bacterium]|nr:hypothetical protein [Xanthobacteraceae bacterium]
MLQNLSKKIQLCYDRAAEAKQCANEANDPEAKADFLKLEQRWLLLANSYRVSESLDTFVQSSRAPVLTPFDPHTLIQASATPIFAKDLGSRMSFAIRLASTCSAGAGKIFAAGTTLNGITTESRHAPFSRMINSSSRAVRRTSPTSCSIRRWRFTDSPRCKVSHSWTPESALLTPGLT